MMALHIYLLFIIYKLCIAMIVLEKENGFSLSELFFTDTAYQS